MKMLEDMVEYTDLIIGILFLLLVIYLGFNIIKNFIKGRKG